jgi:hypothetical protein
MKLPMFSIDAFAGRTLAGNPGRPGGSAAIFLEGEIAI